MTDTATDPEAIAKQNGDLFREVGSVGLNMAGGDVIDEPLRQLRGDRGRATYRQMDEDDSVIGGMMFAVSMLFRQGDWPVEPHPDDDSDDLAEWFTGAFHDLNTESFTDHVSAALSMLAYGWSLHEILYKRRDGHDPGLSGHESDFDDGLIGWAGFPLRSQSTLLRWHTNERNEIDGMVQLAPPTNQSVLIPFEKALHYRTTAARGNPEGRSALRNAYRDWYFKTRTQEIEGIGIERDLAGLPVGWLPPEYLSPNATSQQAAAAAEFKKILRNIRRDDQAAVAWPLAYDENGNKLFDLTLLSSGGQRQIDTGAVITRYDQRIAMSILADFILLGHERIGTQALSKSKVDIFVSAIKAWMDAIADVLNRQGIARLMRINGFDLTRRPSVRPTGIEQVDLEELAKYVHDLAGSGMPLFPDSTLQGHLREVAGLPPEPADFEDLFAPATPDDDAE